MHTYPHKKKNNLEKLFFWFVVLFNSFEIKSLIDLNGIQQIGIIFFKQKVGWKNLNLIFSKGLELHRFWMLGLKTGPLNALKKQI